MQTGIIEGYPIGSDITFIESIYERPKKLDNGKYSKDVLTIIFRDNTTGEKKHVEIEEPEYTFYIAKEQEDIDHNLLFIDKDKVIEKKCKYREREKALAEITGNKQFYLDCLNNRNFREVSKIHTHQRLFMTDQEINDHYRFIFNNQYKNETFTLNKAYFDIEVDIINMNRAESLESNYGRHPINAVTIIDSKNNVISTLILKYPGNPATYEFEKYCQENDFATEIKQAVQNHIGGWKNEIRYGLDKMRYDQVFYEDEVQMLVDLFTYIHHTKPDFILAWNIAFDLQYIIERLKYLGVNPEDVLCHPDFNNKTCYYYEDTLHRMYLEERGDYSSISSYSVYIDQMVQYASRRKGRSKLPSYSLDYVGTITTGIKKLDYSHITTDIAKFPYLDFKLFIMYNIMDTIVQKCTEEKCDDIGYIFNKALMNNTRYCKAHRQTVYLTNRGAKEFYNQGLIIGNNVNKFNPKPEEKFPGALVGNPLHVHESMFIKVNNGETSTRLIDNCNDFDYASLYPSIINQMNMAPNTQIGKIIIDKVIYDNENPYNKEQFSRGGKFIEDLHSHNIIEFCQRWIKLASYRELYEDIIEYYTTVRFPSNGLQTFDFNTGLINGIMFGNVQMLQQGIQFDPQIERGVLFNYHKEDLNKIMERVNYEPFEKGN